jgi:fibronectin type 3 domain-containing protein
MGTRKLSRLAPLLAAALLGSIAGCATLGAQLERRFWEWDLELTFDPPADLHAPERIHIVNTEERQVTLAWDPVLVDDVQGYAILRSAESKGPFELSGRTVSRFGTVFTDRGPEPGSLGDAKTYYYRVHAFDQAGSVSRSFASARAATDPPPEAPGGLRAYSNRPRLVVLTWDASPSRSVAGYGVYRSPTAAGPWDRVAHVPDRFGTVYEDRVAGDLRVMYYRLTATNRYRGESESTEPVRAVTKAEPLPPVGLKVTDQRLGSVELRWEPNVERDLVEYEVWRARFVGSEFGEDERIGVVAAPSMKLRDDDLGCGERVRYRVRVTDADGLVSEFSRPLEVAGTDIGLRVDSSRDRRVLRWHSDRVEGWMGVRLYKHRRLLPDALLAQASDTRELALPELGSGTHRVAVVLVRPPVGARGPQAPFRGADPSVEFAPPCEVEVRVP